MYFRGKEVDIKAALAAYGTRYAYEEQGSLSARVRAVILRVALEIDSCGYMDRPRGYRSYAQVFVEDALVKDDPPLMERYRNGKPKKRRERGAYGEETEHGEE